MESTRMTQAKHNTTQLDWYLGNLGQQLPNPQLGFLGVLLNSANRFVRRLSLEKDEITRSPMISSRTLSRLTIAARARTNQQGIDIIKQFEGFPPDVDPDVREAEQVVRQLVQVPLTSNQFSALVSFTYSLGETTLKQSALLKYLNAGRYRAAAKEFKFWVYIGSTRFPKLAARRGAERALFLKAEAN